MALALVFPGQGSQSTGMLAALAAVEPVVRRTFDEASGVLGYDLWDLVQTGPEERLSATEVTQPAMLVGGVAVLRAWRVRGGPEPAFVCGHSLGEFTALVCAGALEFRTAVELVRFRGRAMQEAVPAGVGAIAAILGLDDVVVEAVCAEAAQGAVVEAVNYNSPAQVVIAGERAAVERALAAAKARGAKRAVHLPMSVPSHSSLMRPAAVRFAERVAGVTLVAPQSRYFSVADAREHADPAEIRALLVRLIAGPVRWTDTVRALVASGATRLYECGPGKVLTGLNRRIERRPEIDCRALESPADLDGALAALGKGG